MSTGAIDPPGAVMNCSSQKKFRCIEISTNYNNINAELIGIDLLLSSGKIIIIYRFTLIQHESLDANRSFLNCLHKLTDDNYSIILAGDFNLPRIDWLLTTNPTKLTHDLFPDFFISRSLEQ